MQKSTSYIFPRQKNVLSNSKVLLCQHTDATLWDDSHFLGWLEPIWPFWHPTKTQSCYKYVLTSMQRTKKLDVKKLRWFWTIPKDAYLEMLEQQQQHVKFWTFCVVAMLKYQIETAILRLFWSSCTPNSIATLTVDKISRKCQKPKKILVVSLVQVHLIMNFLKML